MTVIKDMIPLVSPFTVGPSGDFTQNTFDQYKIWAEEELKKDDPGLSTAKYDEAWANLICHIFLSSQGERDIKSEKIRNYSYTSDRKTSYYLRYEEIIKPQPLLARTTT